uniref:G-protein coupled receptors family 1 profile domain-containing protein n=1 Tax=Panagrolaimus sp. PS1159 TaxID=55785 RepID=A0AC35FUC7_9BILA
MSSFPRLTLYDTTKQFIPIYWTYCGIGLFAFIANLFIVFIYLSSAQFRSRFTLFISLAIAEGINGAAFLMAGIARLLMEDSFRAMYSYPRTLRSDCALQFENSLLVIGNQGPAMLSLALGIERFCAIRFPTTYRHFKEKMFHVLLILSAVICITSLCVALYIGLVIEKDLLASLPCTLSNAFGFTYT